MITIEVVHEALSCLYSPTDLAKTALAEMLPDCRNVTDLVQRAQIARGILLDCIQALRPNNRSGPTASASRAYDCLKLRFVSGLTVEDASFELSLSTRQFYRDLRWAEERLTELLRSRIVSMPASQQAPGEPDALTEEVETIARQPQRLSLGDVVGSAITALATIAERYGVRLRYEPPPASVMVTATPGMLRQLIIQLLSSIVQGVAGGDVSVSLAAGHGVATLAVSLSRTGGLARPDLLDAALRVAEAQGLGHHFTATGTGTELQIGFPLAERETVLVVEDKPGAYALYERYLESTEFQPLHVPHPAITVETAAKREVAAIVLDVMMPEADGWSVLQALKADPRTEGIPVVICSVVQDRELGLALGASGYLTKPVSRVDFLEALRQVRPLRNQA